MSIYDVNYNSKAIELLPPDKRYPATVGFLQSLLVPVQYLRDKILGDYRLGRNYPQWVAGTYALRALVVYKQVVYESLIDGNTDQPPSPNWVVYLPSFIGVDKRIKFNGQKLVLEYALNQYLFTNFRQPPLVSDVFIGNLPPTAVGFLVGATVGSTITASDTASYSPWSIGSYSLGDLVTKDGYLYLSLTNSNVDKPPSANWHQADAIGYTSTFRQLNNFVINIPSAVFFDAGIEPNIEQEVRTFVDKIIPSGLRYLVVPY